MRQAITKYFFLGDAHSEGPGAEAKTRSSSLARDYRKKNHITLQTSCFLACKISFFIKERM